MDTRRVALVGDYDATVTAHQAIPLALSLVAEATGVRLQWQWIPTQEILSERRVESCDGIWCVPASPYRSMDGALRAIRFARESGRPFLGTCGGFQHAIVEYARSVLGWSDAEHAESMPGAVRPVVTPLACSLVEARGVVRLSTSRRSSSRSAQRFRGRCRRWSLHSCAPRASAWCSGRGDSATQCSAAAVSRTRTGIVNEKIDPPSRGNVAQIRPPSDDTTSCTMVRPRPDPSTWLAVVEAR